MRSLTREHSLELLDVLLIDRTMALGKENANIIWATDNYVDICPNDYAPTSEIKRHLITGNNIDIIVPRALKNKELQKERTKQKAEVFTPSWIVKKQNDLIDENFKDDDLETYVSRTWLEITCGEAPYMASRYEMDTGVIIPIEERVGFVDRKLARISKEVSSIEEWFRLADLAYKASYGFEWSGDSLLIARENLLYTFIDYYVDKWEYKPRLSQLLKIAEIISYNVFQMDGLTYTIPLSGEANFSKQTSLFDPLGAPPSDNRVRVMDWKTGEFRIFGEEL